MKVIAIKPGYFVKLRAAGDEFEVPDDTKPASWFEPVEKPAKADKPEKPAKA
jgi:hypothetical protein